jgi:hypothetical protein
VADTAQELVYDEALRSIRQQQEALSGLHSRAGTLLAVAGVSVSFLGGAALGDNADLGCLTVAALIVFALLGIFAFAVIWPWWGWKFSSETDRLIADFVNRPGGPADVSEMHRTLAESMEGNYKKNQKKLGLLYASFQIASVLLFVDIGLWLIDLGTRN